MQTHKNPSLRSGPAPFKAPAATAPSSPAPLAPLSKPPVFTRDGKKWLIVSISISSFLSSPMFLSLFTSLFNKEFYTFIFQEHQKGNQNLIVEGADMNNVVYMFGCVNSTLTVKGKINSVFLDSCKKTSVLFDSLVSSVEFVNCQSVQMQVFLYLP